MTELGQPEQLAKPPYGDPCNRCGLCCQNEICPLGAIVFPACAAPCPALEHDAERQVCGLIAHPERYAPIRAAIHGVKALREAAIFGVGADIGCDSLMADETVEPSADFVRALRRIRYSAARAAKIRRLWGGAR